MIANSMTNSPARPGFTAVTPYLVLPRGSARNFLAFLVRAFDGVQNLLVPRPDGSLMHAEARLGDAMIEFADADDVWTARPAALRLLVPDTAAARAAALEAGATQSGEAIRDPFGNSWHLDTADPVISPGPSLQPYLLVADVAGMITFLEATVGAELLSSAPGPANVVHHARLRIGGDGLVELHESPQPLPVGLHHYVADADAAYHRATAAGALLKGPPADQPYGERMCEMIDPAGNSWFLAQVLGR